MFKRANQVQRLMKKIDSLIDERNSLMLRMLKINNEIGIMYNDINSPLKGYNQNYASDDDCISHADFETVVRPYVKHTMIMPESNPLDESEKTSCHLK